LLFMNDDVIIDRDFLARAVCKLESLKDTLLLPQVIDRESGLPRESGVNANLKQLTFEQASSPYTINCLPTRGLFLRMGDLRRIGWFHPRMLPHYLSDYEFTIRAYRKGFRLVTCPTLSIEFDPMQTGFRNFDHLGFIAFARQYFSKKSVSNPLHWTSFILLAVPGPYIVLHVFRVWRSAMMQLVRRVRYPASDQQP